MLELVESKATSDAPEGRPRQLVAPTTRPTERHEPWPLDDVEIDSLAEAAFESLIDLGVACSVVMERRTLLEDLSERQVLWLDRLAESVRPTVSLSAPSAAYLRSLSGNQLAEGRSRSQTDIGAVPIPARLTDRLMSVWPPTPPLEGAELAPALVWERASVMTGLTMTEWVYRELVTR